MIKPRRLGLLAAALLVLCLAPAAPAIRAATASPRRCGAGTLCVGPDQRYPTLAAAVAAAHPGDMVEIAAGTYREALRISVARLTIRGAGGTPRFDCTGLHLVEDKACLLLAADGITLDNLEVRGAELPDRLGANGACIRNEPGLGFTLRHIRCHGSQDGILSSGGAILIEDSEFFDNGWTDRTHNVYFGGDCTVVIRRSIFRDARIGHEFKSRCRKTQIFESRFDSTRGSRDLDLPDGGDVLVYRSTLIKGRGAESRDIIGFAAESCAHPGDLVLKEVRIVNRRPDATITNYNRCGGHPIVLQDVTIEGAAPRQLGYVVTR